LTFYSIATLSDASVAQCRANHLVEGAANARQTHDAAMKGFGAHAALTDATLLPLANCLIAMSQFEEASKDLDGIDAKAVAQLAGDPDWGAGLPWRGRKLRFDGGIMLKRNNTSSRCVWYFLAPDAEAYQRAKVDQLAVIVGSRPK
jgi:hypothetical protein